MSHIIGVGFILFSFKDSLPKLFTIKELRNKPQYYKKAGMLSFPLETMEPSDKSRRETVIRILDEEMGISPNQVNILRLVEKEFNLIPGRKDISTFYGYGTFLGNPNQKFTPNDSDIEFAGWKSIKELLGSFIRVEVSPILNHLLSNGFYDEIISSRL